MRHPVSLVALAVVLLSGCGTSNPVEKGSAEDARQYAELFQKTVAKEGPGEALERFPAKVSRRGKYDGVEYLGYEFSYEDEATSLDYGLNIPSWLHKDRPDYRRGACYCAELPPGAGCDLSLWLHRNGRRVEMYCSTDPSFAFG